jgi:hypothetical protein
MIKWRIKEVEVPVDDNGKYKEQKSEVQHNYFEYLLVLKVCSVTLTF